jgi:hypothetical protein
VSQAFANYGYNGEMLYAPLHWYAWVVASLRFAVYQRKLSPKDADLLVDVLPELGVRVVEPPPAWLKSALRWAERSSTGGLWSADRSLVNALQAQAAAWAQWIGKV